MRAKFNHGLGESAEHAGGSTWLSALAIAQRFFTELGRRAIKPEHATPTTRVIFDRHSRQVDKCVQKVRHIWTQLLICIELKIGMYEAVISNRPHTEQLSFGSFFSGDLRRVLQLCFRNSAPVPPTWSHPRESNSSRHSNDRLRAPSSGSSRSGTAWRAMRIRSMSPTARTKLWKSTRTLAGECILPIVTAINIASCRDSSRDRKSRTSRGPRRRLIRSGVFSLQT